MATRLDVSGEQRARNMTRLLATREERLKRAAAGLATTPDALDILHLSLTKLLASPNDERLRKVNISTGVFKQRVADKNRAGVDLLSAIGYEYLYGHLVLQKHDADVVVCALRELEAARQLPCYVTGKATLVAAAARQETSAQIAQAAAARRAAHLAKVPAEPREGEQGGSASSACVITVGIKGAGGGAPSGSAGTRRFDSDCTLDDLVHYIKSLPATPEGALTIENVTTRPARVLDPETEGSLSLYALDLWPRGHVQVQAACA